MDIKELNKIIQLCKKNGITSIKLGDLELKFDLDHKSIPLVYKAEPKQTPEVYIPGGITQDTQIETEQELTAEDLLFYSVNQGMN